MDYKDHHALILELLSKKLDRKVDAASLGFCWGSTSSEALYDELNSDTCDMVAECPDCDSITIDGSSIVNCSYSPKLCGKCGFSPCDMSC